MSSQVKWFGDEILKEIRDATPEGLFAGGQMLIDAAASRAPHGDGDLANSGYVATEEKSTYKSSKIHNKQPKVPKGGAVAGFAAFYAGMVEFGTKPHKIGKPGQLLRMPDGRIVRGPIQHPGTPAKPFFRPALDELKAQVGNEIALTMKKRVKGKK